MLHRINDLLIKAKKQKTVEKINNALQKNVKAVDAYANGTTGYVIKEGSGKGKAKAHLAPNRFQ
jgi:methanogenic corrinoid protein MtbC1